MCVCISSSNPPYCKYAKGFFAFTTERRIHHTYMTNKCHEESHFFSCVNCSLYLSERRKEYFFSDRSKIVFFRYMKDCFFFFLSYMFLKFFTIGRTLLVQLTLTKNWIIKGYVELFNRGNLKFKKWQSGAPSSTRNIKYRK